MYLEYIVALIGVDDCKYVVQHVQVSVKWVVKKLHHCEVFLENARAR